MSINVIGEIVSINEHAVLETGVQLDWYSNKEKNLRLCRGYMFSSGSKYYGNKTSAVNLLSTFKDNLLDDSKENKHIVISGYGTGKTHFALVVANYFSRTSDTNEITGIYEALESSTSKEVMENFKKFKETGKLPQLVIRLRGDVFMNLRSGFLKALKEALSENPLSQNYQIPVIFTSAINWVKGLADVQRKKAEEFLLNNYKINLLQLQQKLENFEPMSDTITEELFKDLINVSPNFGAEANLETVIKHVYNDLCSKPEGPFYKIVIIFDELGLYIDNYRADPIKAAGVALQEITNTCDNLLGKICFISFIQKDPVKYSKEYDKDDIDKFLTRIKKENRFFLATNLELVLKSIILKQSLWKQFMEKHYDEVEITSRLSFGILPYYKKEAWEEKLFLENIVKSCYPLHPITTSLICRLDFAQGRSIIGFINEKIKIKLEEPYEIIRECKGLETEIKVLNPNFNWIYPYEIVDYFEENFKKAKDGKYNELTYALEQVGHNAPEECMQLLQAIFLYYFAKLEKRSIKHEKILEILSGLDSSTTQYYLQELKDIHNVIHQNEARQEYDFYTPGNSIVDVHKRLNNEASLDLPLTSIELVKHLDKKELKELFTSLAEEQGLVADEFTSNTKLSSIEYRLEPISICPNGITEALKQNYHELDKNNKRGFIYYCISESQSEISHAEQKAKTLLGQFKSDYEDYPLPIVFAFPEKPIEGISDLTLRLAILDSWAPTKIKEYGEGYQKAKEDLKRRINVKLQKYFQSLQFITHQKVLGELSTNKQNKQRAIINKLFEVCFHYRPSLNYSTLKTNSSQGKTNVGLCAKFLCNYGRCREEIELKNCDKKTTSVINNIIKNILQVGLNKWGIMNDDGKIIEPKDSNIKRTWNLLNGKIANGNFIKLFDIYKILQEPPFGYDDLTFVLFISSWIGFYQNDLDIDTFNGKIDIDEFAKSVSENNFKLKRINRIISK